MAKCFIWVKSYFPVQSPLIVWHLLCEEVVKVMVYRRKICMFLVITVCMLSACFLSFYTSATPQVRQYCQCTLDTPICNDIHTINDLMLTSPHPDTHTHWHLVFWITLTCFKSKKFCDFQSYFPTSFNIKYCSCSCLAKPQKFSLYYK